MRIPRFTAEIARHWLPALALVGVALLADQASGQIYGRAVSQPYYDFPPFARFETCRPGPVIWGFDPFATVGNDCDPDGCRQGFIAHRPSDLYAAIDFVPLTYDPNHDIELARFGADGPTALSTSDLDTEFDSGARITLGTTLWGCYQVEGVYQGIYSWDDTAAFAFQGPGANLTSVLTGFAPGAGSLASTSLFSEMQTAEFNVRTWLELPPGPFDVQLLVGARYMSIDESFNFQFDAPAANTTAATDNDLWGVQLGIDFKVLVHPRVYIDFDAKGAICNNNASVSIAPNPAANTPESDRTAFLGDFLLTANWQMTPSWSIRAGYQAIFVNGVATGPDNLNANAALLGAGQPIQIDDRGEVVYHGPVLGVMWMR